MNYFSKSYIEAHKKFSLQADRIVQQGRGTYYAVQHSHISGIDNLFTSFLLIGDMKASKKMVVTSGVHGAEGFPGTALQLKFLDEFDLGILKKDTAIILVHAINPYGMSELRRVNEDNIDLNRNFLNLSSDLPNNDIYSEIHPIIINQEGQKFSDFVSQYKAFKKEYIQKNGYQNWQNAMVRGQYQYADGILYGGKNQKTFSRQMMEAFVDKWLLGTEHLVFVDLHSGFDGKESGEVALLPNANMTSDDFQRACEWWGGEMEQFASDYLDTPSLAGEIACVFDRKKTGLTTFTSVTVEFCTDVPLEDTIDTLVFDNWIYHADKKQVSKDLINENKQRIKKSYCSDDQKWQEKVLQNGMPILKVALEQIEQLHTNHKVCGVSQTHSFLL